jgi:hypothetical protein
LIPAPRSGGGGEWRKGVGEGGREGGVGEGREREIERDRERERERERDGVMRSCLPRLALTPGPLGLWVEATLLP